MTLINFQDHNVSRTIAAPWFNLSHSTDNQLVTTVWLGWCSSVSTRCSGTKQRHRVTSWYLTM